MLLMNLACDTKMETYINTNPFVSYNSLGELPQPKTLSIPQNSDDSFTKLDILRQKRIERDQRQALQELQEKTKTEIIQSTPIQISDQTIEQITTPMDSKSVSRKDMVSYLQSKGLKKHQAQAIAGNLWQESAGKTKILSKDGYGSIGLAQWTGDRRKKLELKYGKNSTWQNQLDFLLEEMNTTEKHRLAKAGWDSAQDVNSATEAFMRGFERPSEKYANLKARLKYANEIV